MTAGRVLMIQGSSSSVGKSLLVAGLCRLFARRGVRVAPFKAQNMSNNAAVCADGSEIGRAQALQARAAFIAPAVEMNPILLKPEADCRSQVVVLGKVWQTLPARSYWQRKQLLWAEVTAALDRLRRQYELVLIEGAGSPVELNLKAGDIVNMAVACHANAPVLLVGDIDRGGVFAQLLGTLALLPSEERRLVRGLIVNKFRGDATLFADGVRILEERGGVPVLGVVPYLPNLDLPEEDAATLMADPLAQPYPSPTASVGSGPVPAAIEIAVVRLPRIANFDDFDPLRHEPAMRLRFVDATSHFGHPDAVILPGSKSTIADLRWLVESGLGQRIAQHANAGGAVVGICGGYQMLGRLIRDPQRIESDQPEAMGLGLLPIDTTFAPVKSTHQVQARIIRVPPWLATPAPSALPAAAAPAPPAAEALTLDGYEIHAGQSASASPWLEIVRRGGRVCRVPDGAMSPDGRVWGCYLHGLFANDGFRRAWLRWLPALRSGTPTPAAPAPPADDAPAVSAAARLEQSLDRLAEAIARAIPLERIEQIIAEGV
jgi:adenosylcobyric acid synthase